MASRILTALETIEDSLEVTSGATVAELLYSSPTGMSVADQLYYGLFDTGKGLAEIMSDIHDILADVHDSDQHWLRTYSAPP